MGQNAVNLRTALISVGKETMGVKKYLPMPVNIFIGMISEGFKNYRINSGICKVPATWPCQDAVGNKSGYRRGLSDLQRYGAKNAS